MSVTPKVRDSPPRGPPGETEAVPDGKNPASGGEKDAAHRGGNSGKHSICPTPNAACRGDAPDPYAACGRTVSPPKAAGADERRGGGGRAMREKADTRTEGSRADGADGEKETKESEKECLISFRVTVRERERLDRLAAEAGLTRSDFVRACVSGKEIRQRQGAEIGQLYTEINRIGNNINQIARSVNAGIADAKDAREALFLLRKVYEKMEAVADK